MKAIEYYQKRYHFLEKLYLIYPEIQFQAQNKSGWTTYFDMEKYDDYRYYPTIHYRLLPNEIVIELFEVHDDPSLDKTPLLETVIEENKDFGNFTKTIEVLDKLEIPCIFGFSGNNSFHVHIYLAPSQGSLEDFVHLPECQLFTTAVYEVLVKMLINENVLGIGRQVMKHRRIRSFYSQHIKTGNFKIPSTDEIEFWRVPRIFYLTAKKYMQRPRYKPSEDDEAAIKEALQLLERFKKRETSTYIYYTCPFHQPDRDPSFTFNKRKKMFTDWHDNKVYSAKRLLNLLV